MTTPRNELYNLSNRIKYLTELFENDEDDFSIFDKVKEIDINNNIIEKCLDFVQDQMSLIIKLLIRITYDKPKVNN